MDDRTLSRQAWRERAPRRNDGEFAADEMRARIVRGQLRAGERVLPEVVGAAIGLSRIPVREGIVALECEGFVAVEPKRGTRVTGLTRSIVEDHYEVTGMVRALVIRWVIERASGDVLKEVQGLADRVAKPGPPADTVAAGRRCLDGLLDVSASGRAAALLQVLPDLLTASALDPGPDLAAIHARDLGALGRLVRARDGDAAAQTITRFHRSIGAGIADLLSAAGALAVAPEEVLAWPAGATRPGTARNGRPPSLRPSSFAGPEAPAGGRRVERLVRDRIIRGRIPPGSRIDLKEIADLAGVSTTPLREAMITLERQGWVTIEPHRGVFVTTFDKQDALDHYDLFATLFAFATRRLIDDNNPVVVDSLRREVELLQEARDVEQFEETNRRLVDLLVGQARSRPLVVALRATPEVIVGNFFERVPLSIDGHRSGYVTILEAVEARDAAKAEQAWSRMLRIDATGAVAALDLR